MIICGLSLELFLVKSENPWEDAGSAKTGGVRRKLPVFFTKLFIGSKMAHMVIASLFLAVHWFLPGSNKNMIVYKSH